MKYNATYQNLTEEQKLRQLQVNDFENIRIFVDTSFFEYACDFYKKSCNTTLLVEKIDQSVKVMEKLIKVKPLSDTIMITESELEEWEMDEYYNSDILYGISADLLILTKKIDALGGNFRATSEQKKLDPMTKRPIVGIITFDVYYFNNFILDPQYFVVSFLHQMTHILGFYYESFKNFPIARGNINNVVKNETKRLGISRQYIITETVKEKAKLYYGCNEDSKIFGVELEHRDKYSPGSHWGGRTLLGEYMNADIYSEEQAISEFTLALLEDSGWYKVNYYTGGLMRFGKNKGCNFLTDDCTFSNNKFKNEFFNLAQKDNPSCSSGRQSRTYCNVNEISELQDTIYQRYEYFGGKEIAEYCLVFSSSPDESDVKLKKHHTHVGSCKYGNEFYGDKIQYKNGEIIRNSQIPAIFGEVIGDESFCLLSSIYPNNKTDGSFLYEKFIGFIHPMCYPIFCSTESLTVQIYSQYIVCPQVGGRVDISRNYSGSLFCPDFNLMCTGTVPCNDIVDCALKESEPREKIQYSSASLTNQNIKELEKDNNIKIGYELSENGVCPKDCCECLKLKKCFKCKDDSYKLIGVKEDDENPIKCNNTVDISERYYLKDNVYYPCTDNCLKCNKTHCFECHIYYKLNQNNTLCIDLVEHCEKYNITYFSSSNKVATCIKCKTEGNIVYAFLRNDRSKCLIIDNTTHYTTDGGISYYPCNESISLCEKCSFKNNCTRCYSGAYFLKEDRKVCHNDFDLDKYYTLDNGISYYPCDTKIPKCDICKGFPNNCTYCKEFYYFYRTDRKNCINNLTLTDYYTTDGGVSYFPCSEPLENCKECDNPDFCNKCKLPFAFIALNRTFCFNITNKNKYYTNDNGISYYPCNTHFDYCDECSSETVCTRCMEGYGFIYNVKTSCKKINNKNYFTEDGGISYYPCNYSVTNCDECTSRTKCTKCYTTYYFIGDDRGKCYNDKNLSKYYTEDEGISYYPCDTKINHCDTCENKNKCKTCKDEYYFLGYNRQTCFHNITNFKKFYTQDNGISYFSCELAMENCEECSLPNICSKCYLNYYLTFTQENKCYNIDLKKYYTNDNRFYFPCNYSVSHCDECYSQYYCHYCYEEYALKLEVQNECFEESYLSSDNEYFKINETHYKKCSNEIDNCLTCISASYCSQCIENYYFLNENHKNCVNKEELVPEDEYCKYDDLNYFSCGYTKAIKNCVKCKDHKTCTLCQRNYAYIYNDPSKCLLKSSLEIGYYSNKDGTIYYPCLAHCDKCINGTECQQCAAGYALLADKTLCEICQIEMQSTNREFSQYLFDILITEYLSTTKNNVSEVYHYVNQNKNHTVTIFKSWECTSNLLEAGYANINTRELTSKLSTKFNLPKTSFAFLFITNNYKNSFSIYNALTEEEIVIEEDCPELKNVTYEITNNFKSDVDSFLGNKVGNEVMDKKIDIFDENDGYFNNVCKRFSLEGIDFALKKRGFFYLGNLKNEIVCTDFNCEVQSKEMGKFTGNCKCPINSDINHLFVETEIKRNEISLKSNIITLSLFKCVIEGFKNIGSNAGFFIGLFLIIGQVALFIVFFASSTPTVNPPKSNGINDIKDTIANPIKKPNASTLIVENFDKLQDSVEIIPPCQDHEKSLQDLDEIEFEEDEYTDEQNDEYPVENKHYVESDSKKTDDKTEFKKKPPKLNLREKKDYCDSEDNLSEKKKKKKKKNNNLVHDEESEDGDDIINNTSPRNSDTVKKYKKYDKNNIDSKQEIDEEDPKQQAQVYIQVLNQETKAIYKASFCKFYCLLLGLRQPILALFSFTKCMRLLTPYTPYTIRIITIIFILGLNIFLNEIHLTQKYYSSKYDHFDGKYNIRYEDNKIASGEKFSYAIGKNIPGVLISFLICLVVQELIYYFLLNIRRKINEILEQSKKKKIHNAQENKEIADDVKILIENTRRKYVIIFFVNSGLMIIFFIYSISFCGAYDGGSLDFLATSLLTFILLNLIPFIICFFIASIRHCCFRKSEEEKMNKFSELFTY